MAVYAEGQAPLSLYGFHGPFEKDPFEEYCHIDTQWEIRKGDRLFCTVSRSFFLGSLTKESSKMQK